MTRSVPPAEEPAAAASPGPVGEAPTYRAAGVDIAAASRAVERIAAHAAATLGADAAPLGHFGGIYRLPAGGDRLLVASADGVGTKLKLAFVLGGAAHAGCGRDLVNHCVNDILALGARPLFFLDYVAMGRLDGELLEQLVAGMAGTCRVNGLALIGGETAEMPGFYAPGEYDVAGFIVGEVAPDRLVDGRAVRAGDVLLGLPSAGLHTNGYSLARRILGLTGEAEADRARLAAPLPGGNGETLGQALLAPHVSYLGPVWPLLERGLIRGMAHITGGGLLDNLPRMLPDDLGAELDAAAWPVPPIFRYLCAAGRVPVGERYRVFNQGIGFVLAVAPADATAARAALPDAREIGRVVARPAGGPGERVVVRGERDGDGADA